MKKYIISLSLFALIAAGGGYLGASFFSDGTGETGVAQVEPFDKAKELGVINNLIKTYIVSSVKFDWETIKVLSSGEYKTQLEESIIPQSKKIDKADYAFNPRSMKVEVKTITPDQAIADVTYIVTKGKGKEKISSQENITIFLGRNDNHWSIIKIEVPK